MSAADLAERIEAQHPDGVELRHELHRHPQLAYEETHAAGRVAERLAALGIPFTEGVAETGVVGCLEPTDRAARERPAVGLRADMDALPITEETDLPYASTSVGRMHACGHDGHTAVLLSAASVLADRRARLPQPVKLIFQPAEELRGGAKRMVEEGVLEEKIGGHRVARLFGLHGWPGLPLHTVGSRPGPIMASMDNFTITVRGRGAHGAAPHQGRDPLLAASHVVTALQSVVGREIDPADAAVLTVGSFQAGQSPAVMPESAELTGTIRALRAETASAVQKRVREIAESTAQALGCTAETTWQMGYPPTVNDETCHARVLETARAALGPDHTTTLEAPSMAAEDFAFYQQTAAGAFFFLGLCPPEHSAWPGLHTPRFDFHDEALRTGTRMMCELALADHGGGPAARTCR